jgi:hypothetical protein
MGRIGRVLLVACAVALARPALAQTLTHRGFAEGAALLFPQTAPNDPTRAVGDFVVREEAFAKPAPWIQFAGGVELRANSHDQVEDSWTVDVSDRTTRRPRLALRRLSATLTRGPFTVDAGKQFIRWGKTDIVTPTDRFAPRDFLNVVDNDFLPVAGVRATLAVASNTVEGVWVPRLTPSRLPLLNQRWTVLPAAAAAVPLIEAGEPSFPSVAQAGIRWSHVGAAFEYSLSVFDGLNHLPNIEVTPVSGPLIPPAGPAVVAFSLRRLYPAIRTYGGDVAVPTRWVTVKGEAAYFTSTTPQTDEYVLYVIQLERQTGEWTIVGGYAGEAITDQRAQATFAPDRGMTRAIVGRAAYTIDPNRSVASETAIRLSGDGVYAKGEYSQTRGQHWRATIGGAIIAGEQTNFLGQYRRNSHATLTLRYSF